MREGVSKQTASKHTAGRRVAPPRPSASSRILRSIQGPDGKWILAIAFVAFVLRLVYVYQLRRSPYFASPEMDSLYNHQWGEALAKGEPFVSGPYFRPPLYPMFLGLIYRLFGTGPWAPRIAQAAIGAANCGLLFVIGRNAFGRTAGIIAGIAAALYGTLAYFDAELLSPTLIIFFTLLLVWGLLRSRSRPSAALWFVNGGFLGLSAVTRPDILIFAPVILGWIAFLHRARWRSVGLYALCFIAGCMVSILPVSIRNYAVGRDAVLITANGGVNFYIGNNPRADGTAAIIPGDPTQLVAGYEAQVERAERAEGRSLKASEISDYYVRETFRYIEANPREAFGRMLRKLLFFWGRDEIPNDQDIAFITERYGSVTRFMPIGFWLVGPLGLLGMLLCFRRPGAHFPLWGTVCVYMAISVVFFTNARFRIAAVMALIVLGSHAAEWLYRQWRAGHIRRFALAAAVLVCGVLLVWQTPPNVDRLHVQGYGYAGMALAKQGRYAEAESMLAEAKERAGKSKRPFFSTFMYSLGYVRFQQRNYSGALPCFREAAAADPNAETARWYLAVTLDQLGEVDDAFDILNRLILQNPNEAKYQLALGKLMLRANRVAEALPLYARALELDRSNGKALAEVVRLLIRDKRKDDALRLLTVGLSSVPDDPELAVLLRDCQKP